MDTLRGLTVWLLPPILASVICTFVWQVVWGNPIYWQLMIGVGVVSLLFTVGGSTMLTLVFAQLSTWSVAARYFGLMIVGVVVGGGGVLLVSGRLSEVAFAGAAYGGMTAVFWVAFHRFVYGRR